MSKLDKLSTCDRIIIDLEGMNYQCMKVIGMYNYLEIKGKLKMHRHYNMLEICYLEKGAQHYYVNGKDYYLKGGDVLVTMPGESHGTRSHSEEKGKLAWLIFSSPKKDERLLNLTHLESKYIIDQLLSFKSKRVFKGNNNIANTLHSIFKMKSETDEVLKRIKITNLLNSFLIQIIDCGKRSNVHSISTEIDLSVRYINNNINEDLNLEKLANRANLSLSHYKYKFKKEMGFSPGDFILRQKIEKAKKLLTTGENIADVAYGLMFSSSSYFATVFKRYTGKTPTFYKPGILNSKSD